MVYDHSKDLDTKEREDLIVVKSLEVGEVTVAMDNSKSFGTESSPSLDATGLGEEMRMALNHRRLNPRQIQLFAIAGSIGNTLFVAIGNGVLSGPLCLLLAFIFWATIIWSIAQCQTEIVTLFPVDGATIRLAGRMIDPAVSVTAGWNYFVSHVPYIATVINTVVGYWGYDLSPAILITVSLLFFFAINVWRADLFGEVEFWIALGKALLAIGLMFYTFITMLGGNPLNDRFGFRYWKNPGVWVGEKPVNRLESFINAVNVAGYCMGGPEYISMIAGESKDPRRTLPKAFRTIVARLVIFFIGGALCVGILVPSNDPTLTSGSAGTYTGASPYVISMQRLKIPVLPSVLTAALITSMVSAGNCFTFNASRSLHALALEGQAPKFLRRLNRHGVPYLAVIVVIILSTLAYLALGSSSAQVLNWILAFGTAGAMFNWCIMAMTWIRFNSALKAQGIDRKTFLPSVSRYQPFAGYWAFCFAFVFLWLQGYAVFLRGNWKISTFIFNYGIIVAAGGIGIIWKIVKRTPFYRSKDVDLVTGLQLVDALTEHYRQEREATPATKAERILARVF